MQNAKSHVPTRQILYGRILSVVEYKVWLFPSSPARVRGETTVLAKNPGPGVEGSEGVPRPSEPPSLPSQLLLLRRDTDAAIVLACFMPSSNWAFSPDDRRSTGAPRGSPMLTGPDGEHTPDTWGQVPHSPGA
jgi:hypothetical protein